MVCLGVSSNKPSTLQSGSMESSSEMQRQLIFQGGEDLPVCGMAYLFLQLIICVLSQHPLSSVNAGSRLEMFLFKVIVGSKVVVFVVLFLYFIWKVVTSVHKLKSEGVTAHSLSTMLEKY